MKEQLSKYYKLSLFDGLEAVNLKDHATPFPAHYHQTFNVTLVYRGLLPSQVDNRFISAREGSILITNPYEVHANPCEKQNRVSFFTFYLAEDFMLFCNGGQPVFFDGKVIDDPGLFTNLHKLAFNIDRGTAQPSGQAFTAAFNRLAGGYGSRGADNKSVKTTGLFAEFLAEEPLSKFSLPEVARRFGMDKYKFLRLFKHQTGLTPNNYFILKRIEKSKNLLTRGHELLDIAIELGFYDAAHFSNHFKKFTGVSPGAYLLSS